MSLLHYESAFAKLNPNRIRDNVSPHKIAMLLAVMDLIESGALADNVIYFEQPLIDAFTVNFDRLKTEQDRNNPHLPFFHLRSEVFWHHQIKPGHVEDYSELTTASGPGVINKYIDYAYFDDELFELLNNQFVRDLLKAALNQNLEITAERRDEILDVGNGWDWLECEACVQEYFAMLFKEIIGEQYSKAQHRRDLLVKLKNRSEGSIEFKHQNISAILVEIGYPYISGYKPAFNYQKQLKEVVLAYLAAHQSDLDNLSRSENEVLLPKAINWENMLDSDLPERIPSIEEPKRQYLARKTNFTKREASNRSLGESGEQFVIEFERFCLERIGRKDLAKEVEWSSKDKGDGLGYDVRSFIIEDDIVKDEEHFIEVKTTNSGKFQPFFITDNEVAFSKDYAAKYSLYRVYDFKQHARLFKLPGAVEKHVSLRAKSFIAYFYSSFS